MTQRVERPYDAEVEYLENSEEGGGKAYIDTGIIAKDFDNDFYVDFMVLQTPKTSYWKLFGCVSMSISENSYGMTYYLSNGLYLTFNGFPTNSSNTFNISVGERNNIALLRDKTALLNGNPPYSRDGRFERANEFIDQNFLIFDASSDNWKDIKDVCYFKLYSFKWIKGDKTILDLIPVRIGSVGYMYDRVSGKLFGNSGTGHFILGPDIA